MRRALLGIVLAAGLVAFSGCSFDKSTDVTIDKTFTVNPASSTTTTYTETQIIDPSAQSDDFKKYVSDVTKIEIVSVDYTIVSTTGPANQHVSATLSTGDANGANFAMFAQALNVPILSSVGVTTPMTYDANAGTTFGNNLKSSPNKASLKLDATTDVAPANFVVKVTVHLKATFSVGLFSLL